MREFTLKNRTGEVYRLNSPDNFLHEPEGLGFTRKAIYQKIGTGYELIQDGFEQTSVSGRIMFRSDSVQSAYKRYLKFSEFLQEIPLVLVYRIPGGVFLMDCIPESVEKTEINSAFGMDVGITLTPISMWYKEIKETAADNSVTARSDSLIDSPCCLSFTGVSVTGSTLSWSQKLNNTTVMTGALSDVTIESTDTVFIRTDTNPYQIYKVSAEDVRTNLYSKSVFSTGRFPFLFKGENQFIVTGAEEITIEGRELYETV